VLEARVRNDDVKPSETLDGRFNAGAIAVTRHEVCSERLARRRRVGRQIDGKHADAVRNESFDDCAADAARRSGDERRAHVHILRAERLRGIGRWEPLDVPRRTQAGVREIRCVR
jgi:hypothetical protein